MRKLMIKFLIIGMCILLPRLSSSQNRDKVWVINDSLGMDFNTGLPTVFTIPTWAGSGENIASISDNNGNLLYYITAGGVGTTYSSFSDSHSAIHNSSSNVILNGDSLLSHTSITQGTLFIPDISDTQKYYLIDIRLSMFSTRGLEYAVIDNSYPGGRCISKSNSLINDTLAEKLVAVRHANGRDWWILTHQQSFTHNSNKFIEFLLTPTGFSGPYFQNIGTLFLSNGSGSQGQMVFSKSGNKLGVVGVGSNNIADVFDFDRCSGLLSNSVQLFDYNNDRYGCSFSPDDSKFYVSTFDSLFQFDLLAGNIPNSKTSIWVDTSATTSVYQHRLGPDGKIYIVSSNSIGPNSVYNYQDMNLSVISSPDSVGLSCNFNPYSFNLGGHRCLTGLPNMPNYNLGALEGSPCDTLSVSAPTNWPPKQEIEVFPNPNNGEFMLCFDCAQHGHSATAVIAREEIISLKIYNLLGQEVDSPPLEGAGGGQNTFSIKTKLNPGIYYLQTTGKDGRQSNARMVVMKE